MDEQVYQSDDELELEEFLESARELEAARALEEAEFIREEDDENGEEDDTGSGELQDAPRKLASEDAHSAGLNQHGLARLGATP